MADLFQTSRTNIVEHIKHIYAEDELDEASACRNFRQVLDLYATSVDYDPTGGFPPIPLYRNRSRPPLHLCGRAEPECGQELPQVLCRGLP